MKRHNKQILKVLKQRTTSDPEVEKMRDAGLITINAYNFKKLMPTWDCTDDFPMDMLETSVRLWQWLGHEFTVEAFNIVKKFFPDYMRDIYLEVAKFKDDDRMYLTSFQETARLLSYPELPVTTHLEKSRVVYRIAIDEYTGVTAFNTDTSEVTDEELQESVSRIEKQFGITLSAEERQEIKDELTLERKKKCQTK